MSFHNLKKIKLFHEVGGNVLINMDDLLYVDVILSVAYKAAYRSKTAPLHLLPV